MEALQDSEYKQRLLENPKRTIEDTLGIKFADEVTIQVHEADETTGHLVLPDTRDIDSELESEEVREHAGDLRLRNYAANYTIGRSVGVLYYIPPGMYEWS